MKPVQNKKSWWPIGIVSVFVMFVSWIATFIGIAVTNSMDLVSDNYYADEIQFQERIDSTKRAAATTGFTLEFDSASDQITLQLPEEHIGRSVTGKLKLYRPDNAKLDHSIDLAVSEKGQQTLALGILEKGNWKVETSWTAFGETFYATKDIVIGKK
jgi:nitrogen fixation protein FixH